MLIAAVTSAAAIEKGDGVVVGDAPSRVFFGISNLGSKEMESMQEHFAKGGACSGPREMHDTALECTEEALKRTKHQRSAPGIGEM